MNESLFSRSPSDSEVENSFLFFPCLPSHFCLSASKDLPWSDTHTGFSLHLKQQSNKVKTTLQSIPSFLCSIISASTFLDLVFVHRKNGTSETVGCGSGQIYIYKEEDSDKKKAQEKSQERKIKRRPTFNNNNIRILSLHAPSAADSSS
jgi:hypothetical protein